MESKNQNKWADVKDTDTENRTGDYQRGGHWGKTETVEKDKEVQSSNYKKEKKKWASGRKYPAWGI